MHALTARAKRLSWILQPVVAAILAQALDFEFTATPESVDIVSTLGVEPAGRIGSGIAEAVAVVLLLVPASVAGGAADRRASPRTVNGGAAA